MKNFTVCRFGTILDIPVKKQTYETIKARVLEAGRFSCFEPTRKTAWIFNTICQEPDLEIMNLGFPWTGVRVKAK